MQTFIHPGSATLSDKGGRNPELDQRSARADRPARAWRACPAAAALAVLVALSTPAHAVDGCLVLLCLAAPSWRAIPQALDYEVRIFSGIRNGRELLKKIT